MNKQTTSKTRRLTTRLRHPEPDRVIGFLDLSPRDAAPRLGFPSVEALWAFLRRHEAGGGRVDLGGGAHAYRRGARAWVVRIPKQ